MCCIQREGERGGERHVDMLIVSKMSHLIVVAMLSRLKYK